jgi:hypothetical protein
MRDSSVIILISDGLTPDALDDAIHAGDVPELAALRDAGGRHVLTTVFPSVTGLAYIPMLTGLHPAEAGVPGLRWYDRSRRLPALLGHSRSYVGTQIRRMNDDLAPGIPVAFELAGGKALGAAAMITRGLPRRNQLDRGLAYAARVVRAHVTGDVGGWASLEEELAERLVTRVRLERPRFVFAAFTAGDKAAHAGGANAPGVNRSLRLVDHVAGAIRRDAERDGRWHGMHLWVVSDHGHSPVDKHLDLAAELRNLNVRVRSHPWTLPDRSEVAVMVSGNSMAHVYLGLGNRPDWDAVAREWMPRTERVWSHEAIDLIAARMSPSLVELRRGNERAEIAVSPRGLSYRATAGNPLGIECFGELSETATHERTCGSAYPDAVAQLARLVLAERSGDLVISASPGWDLRRQYEPIAHVSSHGALHAAHMLVPLTGNRGFPEKPRRTADLFRFLSRVLDPR